MKGLEGEKQNLKVNTVFNRKPVQLLENRGEMFFGRGSGNDTGDRILNQLKFMEELVRKTRKDRVEVIDTGCNQSISENGGTVGCKRQTKMRDIV